MENNDDKYIDQLEAHLDEGGKVNAQNVRDVIDIYRRAVNSQPHLPWDASYAMRGWAEAHQRTTFATPAYMRYAKRYQTTR